MLNRSRTAFIGLRLNKTNEHTNIFIISLVPLSFVREKSSNYTLKLTTTRKRDLFHYFGNFHCLMVLCFNINQSFSYFNLY